MSEVDLEKKLTQLVEEIFGKDSPQAESLVCVARQTNALHKQLKENVDTLQELLDTLKILFSYQRFDLEATRRENDFLKERLKEKNSDM